MNDFLNSLSIKISRIEKLENDENTLIFRQQSSMPIIQKNFININVKKNENFLTRLKPLELRSRFT